MRSARAASTLASRRELRGWSAASCVLGELRYGGFLFFEKLWCPESWMSGYEGIVWACIAAHEHERPGR
jgi:hypothetical protein